ncbi:hypothetical protein KY342_06605, partial [Candidatus Woesearchaeota archaeon]|nr:hypothetical protein [Candidatus Woesearchaeota archaeon]
KEQEKRTEELEEKLQTQREVIEAAQKGLAELEAERNGLAEKLKIQEDYFEIANEGIKKLEAERDGLAKKVDELKRYKDEVGSLYEKIGEKEGEYRGKEQEYKEKLRKLEAERDSLAARLKVQEDYIVSAKEKCKTKLKQSEDSFIAMRTESDILLGELAKKEDEYIGKLDVQKRLVEEIQRKRDEAELKVLRGNIIEILNCNEHRFHMQGYNRFNLAKNLADYITAMQNDGAQLNSNDFIYYIAKKIESVGSLKPGSKDNDIRYKEIVSRIAEDINDSIIHDLYTEGFYKVRNRRISDKFNKYANAVEDIIAEGFKKSKGHRYVPSYLKSISDKQEGNSIREILLHAELFADDFVEASPGYKEAHKAGDVNLKLAWLSQSTERKMFAQSAISFYQRSLKAYKDEEKVYPDYYWTNENLSIAYGIIGDSTNKKKFADIAKKIKPQKGK